MLKTDNKYQLIIYIFQVPIATVMAEGGAAFNRVSWSPSGTHVIAGDDCGKIWVYEVAEVRTGQYNLNYSNVPYHCRVHIDSLFGLEILENK